MSSSEEEVRQALEGKPLKRIVLPQNSNDIDQGGTAKEEKIGTKSSLARAEYLTARNEKMQYGDKQAIAEYMKEAAEIRERLEQQKERDLLEFDLRQQEKKRLEREARITPQDREKLKEDIEKLERKRDNDINNIHDYFNCPEQEWEKYIHDHHKASESPANVLIERPSSGIGYCCGLHRYQPVLESPTNDGRLVASSFTIGPIEDHIRKYEPQMHKEAIIQSINEKYNKIIEDRRAEDPDITFKKELREIDKIKTRPPGDWGPGTKITKGQKARLRGAEDKQQEENRRVYGGLYS